VSARDTYAGARNDRRHKRNTSRAQEQREQEEQFRRMEMLNPQKTQASRDPSIPSELTKLAARLTIAEGDIAGHLKMPSAKADGVARILAILAIVMAALAIAVASGKFHL
jgi:hypothetical protein